MAFRHIPIFLLLFLIISGLIMSISLVSAKTIPQLDPSHPNCQQTPPILPPPPRCCTVQECCDLYCKDMTNYTMPVGTSCICSRDKIGKLPDLIDRASDWIFYLAMILAPLFILFGAFSFYTAGGDMKKASTGKKIIIWTVIGLAIALCTKLIYNLILFLIGW